MKRITAALMLTTLYACGGSADTKPEETKKDQDIQTQEQEQEQVSEERQKTAETPAAPVQTERKESQTPKQEQPAIAAVKTEATPMLSETIPAIPDAEPAPTLPEAPKQKSVEEICLSSSLDTEQSKTIAALNKEFGTQTCEDLIAKLNKTNAVNLKSKGLKDVSFLANFANIEYLDVRSNEIADFSAFQAMPSLKLLLASNNPFSKNPIELESKSLQLGFFRESMPRVFANQAEPISLDGLENEFLIDPYQECKHATFGIESVNIGTGPVCGLDKVNTKYKACRHSSHGYHEWKRNADLRHYSHKDNPNPPKVRRFDSEADARTYAANYCNGWFEDTLIPHMNRICSESECNIKSRESIPSIDKVKNRFHVARVACWLWYDRREMKNERSPACGFENAVYNTCQHPSFGVVHKTGKGDVCPTSNVVKRVTSNDANQLNKNEGKVLEQVGCGTIQVENQETLDKKLACIDRHITQKNLSAATVEIGRKAAKKILNENTAFLDETRAEKLFTYLTVVQD